MFNSSLKMFLKTLVIGVLLGAALFFVYGRTSQSSSPRIIIAKQVDSPLQLLSIGVDSSNALEPHYSFSVTNKSDKTISTYAIRQQVSLGSGAPNTTTLFVHIPFEKQLLQPHTSRQEDGGFGSSYAAPPKEITLSVDFIEFKDGSRWGEDIGKSGDRLDGQRAGGIAAIKRYREILIENGVQGVETSLNDLTIKAESNVSNDFQNGFTTGVNIVKHRLKTAKQKNGSEGIKDELNKSFDFKSGRQEP